MDVCETMNDISNDACPASRDALLKEIMEVSFVLVELGLFLDTHPDCEKALAMHNECSNKYKKLTDAYQKVYGPLTMNYPCNSWRWGESPWPWERGF